MFYPPKKPSVNDPEYKWIEIDTATASHPDWDIPLVPVILYQQFHTHAYEYVDHYRLKVGGKWDRKTYFGETAWSDMARYAYDKHRVTFGVL